MNYMYLWRGREKSYHELFKVFQNVKKEIPKTKLLFVDPIEKETTIDPDMLECFKS